MSMLENEELADVFILDKKEIAKIEDAKDYAKGLYEALYITGDINKIEGMFEELLHSLDVKIDINGHELKVANKEENKIFNWALGYQRAHIDRTMNTSRNIQDYL